MSRDRKSASYSVPVLPAEALRAVAGANHGDPIGAVDTLSAGDVYRLQQGAAPVTLAIADAGLSDPGPATGGAPVLRVGTGAHRISEDSEAGAPGALVRLDARLTLLASDGHSVDLMILATDESEQAGGQAYLVFPLGPLDAGMEYTLVGIAPPETLSEGALRLADVAPFGFASGTRITMADGTQSAVETLQAGDRVLTRDGGPQELRLVLTQSTRALGPNAPVVIGADTFGNPGDLILSQHQRLLVYQRGPDRLTETAEMLVRAGDLVEENRVFLRRGGFVDYVALVLDHHEMLFAECVAVESLEVGNATRHRLAEDHARAVEGVSHTPHYGSEAGRDIAAAARHRLLHGKP